MCSYQLVCFASISDYYNWFCGAISREAVETYTTFTMADCKELNIKLCNRQMVMKYLEAYALN
jgi:hypothetical protein